MAVSKAVSKGKRKALSKWFPTIADMAEKATGNARAAAKLETLEILMDIEQVTELFASMDDARQGRVVNMGSAFGDL